MMKLKPTAEIWHDQDLNNLFSGFAPSALTSKLSHPFIDLSSASKAVVATGAGMLALKNFLSAKEIEQRQNRLPPIGSRVPQPTFDPNSVPDRPRGGALPPLHPTGGASTSSLAAKPLPNIKSQNGSNEYERQFPEQRLPPIAELNRAPVGHHSSNSGISDLFTTSQMSQQNVTNTIIEQQEASLSDGLSASDRVVSANLSKRGIRTWPVLAVLSVFCCNPLAGMLGAIFTLHAENEFYRGNSLKARSYARGAKAFIIAAVVTGMGTFIGVLIWFAVTCVNFACPSVR